MQHKQHQFSQNLFMWFRKLSCHMHGWTCQTVLEN